MKTPVKVTALAAVAALVAGTALAEMGPGGMRGRGMGHHGAARHAGEQGGGLEMMFRRLDTDRDGAVTFEEYAAAPDPRYDRLDADGDGTITAEEIDAYVQQRAETIRYRLLGMADANGDGAISADELRFVKRQRFTRLDRNGDGRLELRSRSRSFEHRRGGADGRHGGPGRRPPSREGGGDSRPGPGAEEL